MQLMVAALSTSREHIRANRLRALAVVTDSPTEELPGVPTAASFIPGYAAPLWTAMVAPRGTSAEIVDVLNKEINAGLADPAVKARLAAIANEPTPGSPADLGKLMVDETEKWAKVVKSAGIKPG